MNSWWELGEWAGNLGSELSTNRIQCLFCDEKGKFSLAFHAEKKKPNSSKTLNFDTLKCENCTGYVMVLWSASEYDIGSKGLHAYRVLPWPLRIDSAPEHWPEAIKRYWIQAHRNLKDENWDAGAVMARSALQLVLRDNKASGKSLKDEIEDLASKGILPPVMKDWANELRQLGNISAHPNIDTPSATPEDTLDIVYYLDFLLEYLYDLPKKIADFRKRSKDDDET